VNTTFTLLAVTGQGQGQGAIYYLGRRPNQILTPAVLRELAIRGFIGISGQQLINIENLSEIDPAIFTKVRNYNYDDISIRLPADQNYDYYDNDYNNNDDEKENGEEKES